MPIVTIELVSDEAPARGLAARLADEIGNALGARAGATWVRVRTLPVDQYAESGGDHDVTLRPVFVEVLEYRRPDEHQLETLMHQLAHVVAHATDTPSENVHVLYAPDAAGRIAFGGRLRR